MKVRLKPGSMGGAGLRLGAIYDATPKGPEFIDITDDNGDIRRHPWTGVLFQWERVGDGELLEEML